MNSAPRVSLAETDAPACARLDSLPPAPPMYQEGDWTPSAAPFPGSGHAWAAVDDACTLTNRRLERIERRLDDLHSLLLRAAPQCEKMGEHISFVESVMHRVRFPAWLLAIREGARTPRALPGSSACGSCTRPAPNAPLARPEAAEEETGDGAPFYDAVSPAHTPRSSSSSSSS